MIQYFLEVTIAWVLFYTVYALFLKRETFFSVNRWYLLHTLWIGALVPFLRKLPINISTTEPIILEPVTFINYSTQLISESIHVPSESATINYELILGSIYLLGVLFFTFKMFLGLKRIWNIYRLGEKRKHENITLVVSKDFHLPFSFLNKVFLHESFLESEAIKEILDHELTHVKSHHTIDVLLMELVSILFWWNPMIYLYKREIRQTHEYVADAYAAQQSHRKNYGHVLLGQSSSGIELALTHQFFNSHLKKRITMLYKEKSAKHKLGRYLLVIPLVMFLGVLYSFKTSVDSDLKKHSEPSAKLLTSLEDILYGDIESDFDALSFGCRAPELLKCYPNDEKFIIQKFEERSKELNHDIYFDQNEDGNWEVSLFSYDLNGLTEFLDTEKEKALDLELESKESTPSTVSPPGSFNIKVADNNSAESYPCAPIEGTDVYFMATALPSLKNCSGTYDEKWQCTQDQLSEKLKKDLKYTDEAIKNGYQGTTVWDFVVDVDGKVVDVKHQTSLGKETYGIKERGLELLKEMLKDLEFVPAECNGTRVKAKLPIIVSMSLSDEQMKMVEVKNSSNTTRVNQHIYISSMTHNGILSYFVESNLNTPTNVKVYDPEGEIVYNKELPYYHRKYHDGVELSNPINGTYTAVMMQDGKETKATIPVTIF